MHINQTIYMWHACWPRSMWAVTAISRHTQIGGERLLMVQQPGSMCTSNLTLQLTRTRTRKAAVLPIASLQVQVDPAVALLIDTSDDVHRRPCNWRRLTELGEASVADRKACAIGTGTNALGGHVP